MAKVKIAQRQKALHLAVAEALHNVNRTTPITMCDILGVLEVIKVNVQLNGMEYLNGEPTEDSYPQEG